MAHLLLRDTVLSDRRLPLPGRVVVIGRSIDADVPLPHRSISRRHALIECTARGFTVSDLGSSNGTFVTERRLVSGERAPIGIGQSFRVGEVTILLAPDEVIEDGQGTGPSAAPPVRAAGAAAAPGLRLARPAGRRRRRDALRWVGVVVALVLICLAALFATRIAELADRRAKAASPEEAAPEPAEPRRPTVRPLGDGPPDGGGPGEPADRR